MMCSIIIEHKVWHILDKDVSRLPRVVGGWIAFPANEIRSLTTLLPLTTMVKERFHDPPRRTTRVEEWWWWRRIDRLARVVSRVLMRVLIRRTLALIRLQLMISVLIMRDELLCWNALSRVYLTSTFA